MPKLINLLQRDTHAERARLIAGLRAANASIEPKYFYDVQGCALYAAICALDEYYPTRTEAAIFNRVRDEIAALIRGPADAPLTMIDLGAGDSVKAAGWFAALAPARYVAVDIAVEAIADALTRLKPDHPSIEFIGVATDFARVLELPQEALTGRPLVFYPGSSIGNFTPTEARRFLAEIRALTAARGGQLLIGVDAVKDKRLLDAAYDDALGVTAAFNLNVLRHVNRVIGSDFSLADWKHIGMFNAGMSRVEMHLEARREVTVMIDGVARSFATGERIHTENSYKYTKTGFEALLREAGFETIRCWTDENEAFWVFLAA